MANTFTNVYIQTFERNVRFLAQQQGSKLRQFCQYRGEGSKQHNWERVGKLTATTKGGRNVATPINDTPWSRRADAQLTKHAGDLVEPEDVNQALVDPVSGITRALGMALGRAMDDIIIAACTGIVADGNGGTVAFNSGTTPAGTQVVGDGTSAITVDLIAQVTQIFMLNDIDPEQNKVAVVGPVQVRQLIAIEKATSGLYVNSKALSESGMVKNWMGYTWMYSNRLTVPSAGQLACLFFSEYAMGLHVTKDIWTKVQEDPSASFAVRTYGAFTAGSARIEDEHMVEGLFLNS
jgi:hypothetical protein